MRHRMLATMIGTAFLAITIEGADTAGATSRPAAADARRDYDSGAVFLDVRTDEEWKAGHVQGAVHLPVDAVPAKAAAALPDKDRRIVTYCKAGGRAQKAAEALRAAGYTNVVALTGGYADLKAAGYPVEE